MSIGSYAPPQTYHTMSNLARRAARSIRPRVRSNQRMNADSRRSTTHSRSKWLGGSRRIARTFDARAGIASRMLPSDSDNTKNSCSTDPAVSSSARNTSAWKTYAPPAFGSNRSRYTPTRIGLVASELLARPPNRIRDAADGFFGQGVRGRQVHALLPNRVGHGASRGLEAPRLQQARLLVHRAKKG